MIPLSVAYYLTIEIDYRMKHRTILKIWLEILSSKISKENLNR